jgi:hypothetical protein
MPFTSPSMLHKRSLHEACYPTAGVEAIDTAVEYPIVSH